MFLQHGAEKDQIFVNFGVEKPEKIYDFSTNTSIFGDAEAAKDHLCSLLADGGAAMLRDYPDSDSKVCCRYYEKKHHLNEGQIMMVNGSNQGVYLISSFYTGKRVAILVPVYPEYETALEAYKAQVVHCTSFESLMACIEEGVVEAAFVCNPNNPTGAYIDDEDMLDLAKLAEELQVTLVVDEAYMDFLHPDKSRISGENPLVKGIRLGKLNHLILMRSLTKVYQMAGLRVGYLMGSTEQLEQLKTRQPSWSVNSLAQAMLMYYEDRSVDEAAAYYQSESRRFLNQLKEKGFEVRPTAVNYFLLKTEDDTALIRYLLDKGIIVRHTRNHVGLDGKYVRIAVLDQPANDYLIKNLIDYKEKRHR